MKMALLAGGILALGLACAAPAESVPYARPASIAAALM